MDKKYKLKKIYPSVKGLGASSGSNDPIGDALRTDAKAYYTLSDVEDSTGRGNTLTNNNTATFVAGKVGNCVSLPLSDPIKTLSRASTADLTSYGKDFYICLWVKFSGLGTKYIVNKWQQGGDFEYSLDVVDVGVNNFQFTSTFGEGYVEAATFGDITTDTWYFVESYVRTTAEVVGVAVNGGVFDTVSNSIFYDTTVDFVMGEHSSTSLGGFVDEMLVMHRLPTSNERAYLYNSGDGITLYP